MVKTYFPLILQLTFIFTVYLLFNNVKYLITNYFNILLFDFLYFTKYYNSK